MCRLIWVIWSLILGPALLPAFAQPADDAKRLQGAWRHQLSFAGNRFQIRSKEGKALYAGTVRADASAKPPAIDFVHTEGDLKGKACKGIYALDGDKLKICDNAPNLEKGRPTALAAKGGSEYLLVTFKRTKP
jgi:uncharacterized protein (TIGR03067 family)